MKIYRIIIACFHYFLRQTLFKININPCWFTYYIDNFYRFICSGFKRTTIVIDKKYVPKFKLKNTKPLDLPDIKSYNFYDRIKFSAKTNKFVFSYCAFLRIPHLFSDKDIYVDWILRDIQQKNNRKSFQQNKVVIKY